MKTNRKAMDTLRKSMLFRAWKDSHSRATAWSSIIAAWSWIQRSDYAGDHTGLCRGPCQGCPSIFHDASKKISSRLHWFSMLFYDLSMFSIGCHCMCIYCSPLVSDRFPSVCTAFPTILPFASVSNAFVLVHSVFFICFRRQPCPEACHIAAERLQRAPWQLSFTAECTNRLEKLCRKNSLTQPPYTRHPCACTRPLHKALTQGPKVILLGST